MPVSVSHRSAEWLSVMFFVIGVFTPMIEISKFFLNEEDKYSPSKTTILRTRVFETSIAWLDREDCLKSTATLVSCPIGVFGNSDAQIFNTFIM